MPSNPGDGPRHDVPDTTLADLFAAQVARTPESTAVIVDGPAESNRPNCRPKGGGGMS